MSDNGINISGVGGDVIGVGVSGSGHVIGKHVNLSSGIGLSAEQLGRLPGEYAESLKAFTESVNKQLAAHQVPAEQVATVQQEVESLAKEVEGVKTDKPVPVTKQAGIVVKLGSVAKRLLKILPETAETIAAFTPLAPFSKLIGRGVDEVVKEVQSEG